MKKLVIAAAIVCAAAFANAAAVDWSASKVVDPWTTATAGKNTPANGWLGYMILASDYSTVTADLGKGDTASLISSAVGPVKTSTNKGAFNTSTASGSVAAGEQNFYMIVLNASKVEDATYFYASVATSATIDGSLDTTVPFGPQDSRTANASNWTAMPVPEPTSGLLMLLGVAGLALKRKRA